MEVFFKMCFQFICEVFVGEKPEKKLERVKNRKYDEETVF